MLWSICLLPLSLLVQAPPPMSYASVTLSAQVALLERGAPLLRASVPTATHIFPSSCSHPSLEAATTTVLADANTPFEEPEGIRLDTVISLVAPFALACAIFTGFNKLWELFSKQF